MTRMKIWALLLLPVLADATSNQFEERIFNGTDCRDDERMYHVFVEISQKPINYCGGSLLDDRWVITAAHCQQEGFYGHKPLTLKFGRTPAHPIEANNLPPERRRVVPGKHQFVFQHKKLKYDIMLLKLDPPLDISRVEGLTTIDLPPNPCRRPKEGQVIHMAGWGYTSNRTMPHKLQCADMDVTSCTRSMKDNGFTYNAKASVFYSHAHLDTCPGDSGGGVEYKGRLYGVHVRGGVTVCTVAAQATDVCYQPIRDWIQKTIRENP